MEGELQRIVGDNVRRIRLARGMSQEALAEQVGLHRTYWGGIERGRRNLTLRGVERIADMLGVDVHALLSPDMEVSVTVRVTRADYPE
ncbi:helix-turn-helix domain-containing protein [Nocardia higoensis]|uniref:helix-turn-helix domain-containing protein n=1 Tax=Nocardia higoensis TaxID=228599 RepID=UPI000301C958|nr:helix-turn-helix transcriptional regulator [Nocardia higoensis]